MGPPLLVQCSLTDVEGARVAPGIAGCRAAARQGPGAADARNTHRPWVSELPFVQL